MTEMRTIDPYRILFPMGLAHGVVGTWLWIAFSLGWSEYPGLHHSHQMLSGFLLSFSCGFLMTAVPRFTGSSPCSRWELGAAVGLSAATFFIQSYGVVLATFILLAVFGARRFLTRLYSPPPHFLFLPLALVFGLFSTTLLFLAELGWLPETDRLGFDAQRVARTLLFSGVMTAFILGIGAKLIAALLGWAAPPTHRIELSIKNVPQASVFAELRVPLLQALLFAASFGIQLGFSEPLGRALRAAVATWIAMAHWRLHRSPIIKSRLAHWLRVAASSLIIGLWLQALRPDWGVHGEHLVLVSGFGLMTFMVASRVSLAHGGYPLELEERSRVYGAVTVLILFAALTRTSAAWTPSYVQHLAYASATWILGLSIWGAYFLPKILRRSPS